MKTKDILLVDDNISIIYTSSACFLNPKDLKSLRCRDGFKALEVLRNNKIRIVITDFNMPEMNGIELAVRVREQHSGTHVVLVTGKSLSEIVEAAAKAGISEMFSKPLEIRRFLAVIRSSLQAGQNRVLSEPAPYRRTSEAGRLREKDQL